MELARAWKALIVAAALGYDVLVHLALSNTEHPLLLVPLAGAPHAAIYAFLLWLFGRTLLPGREALITGVARRFHGSLAPNMETYTRPLTSAWSVFSAAQLLVSALLPAFSPPHTSPPLVNP